MVDQLEGALCAKCRVPPERVADREAESFFACPRCGVGDTLEHITVEVHDHAIEVTAILAQKEISRSLRGSKALQFQSKPLPKRHYRFISKLKPS